ncbi:lysylphosphatidylglycerol synthase domain-containing protein [Agrococcus sp. Ld7]|uniref:lysylphosphatidylglycerol synthase domain-containing protein n=1 Tax=Agrococcus sp. Ld7 TaxID=649148 RepID=UPI00386671CF
MMRGIRVAFAVAVVVSIAWFVIASWPDVAAALGRLHPGLLVGAVVSSVLGVSAGMLSWRACMRALGADLPLGASASTYFVGQLAKYVPGSVWAVLAQADLAARHGIGRTVTAAASLAQMLVSVLSGMLVGGIGLLLAGTDVLLAYWWIVPASLVCGVALWPPLLQRLLRLAGRVLRRDALRGVAVRALPMLAASAWCAAMWVCFGVQFALLVVPFAADPATLVLAAAAYAFAWVTGFVIIFLPAGAGAREGVLVLALGGAIGLPTALSLALVSRFAMLLGDVLVAVGGWVALRRSGVRPPSPRPGAGRDEGRAAG